MFESLPGSPNVRGGNTFRISNKGPCGPPQGIRFEDVLTFLQDDTFGDVPVEETIYWPYKNVVQRQLFYNLVRAQAFRPINY